MVHQVIVETRLSCKRDVGPSLGIFDQLFGGSKGNRPKKLPRINVDRRFHLLNRIGQGSMSKVWRANDRKTGQTVCVKILDKVKTELLKKRFVGMQRPDEGEVALSLVHPNVVRTLEYGMTFKNEEILIMELIEGIPLNVLVDSRSFQIRGREIDLLIQAGEAIKYFHDSGYIHRDICPRNMMVTPDFKIKLIDFGLAVPNTASFRRPGNRTGTANYMAPELIRRATTDQRIDIFSFGVTIYEMLTGSLPWESAESLQSMLQHLNSPGRDPKELNPELSDEMVAVMMKAIERDPANRHKTMDEVLADLRRLAGIEPA